MPPEDKLTALGLALPQPPKPVATYVPHRFDGGLLYLSGQGPCKPDGSYGVGRLGKGIVIDHAYAYARLTCLHLLAAAKAALGDLAYMQNIVKVLGMVNAEPDFVDHPKVISGCSDPLVEVFGDAGTRTLDRLCAWDRCRTKLR